MTDFPRIAPPADGLALAMATARSRRLRKASASSGASALALAMVAVLAGTSGRSTLTQQPTPEQPAVIVNVVPDGDRKAVDGGTRPNVLAPAPVTTTPPSTGAAPVVTAGPRSTPPFVPSDRDTRSAGGDRELPAVPYKAGPITREDQQNVPIPTCAVQGDGRSYTTCPLGYASAQSDGSFVFEVQLCNNDADPITLTFPGTNEVDFAVYTTKSDNSTQADKEVWRWSTWHAQRADEHTHVVSTAGCTAWTFTYTGVDWAGRPLPKGYYVLRSSLLASSPSGRSVPDTTFTVS